MMNLPYWSFIACLFVRFSSAQELNSSSTLPTPIGKSTKFKQTSWFWRSTSYRPRHQGSNSSTTLPTTTGKPTTLPQNSLCTRKAVTTRVTTNGSRHQGAVDPCTMRPEDVFIVEHHPENATKSTNVTSQPGGKLLCDRCLTEGWYIFLAPAAPNETRKSLTMANECVPNYRCGTQYTMWMNGTIPDHGGVFKTHSCVSMGRQCCAYKRDLQVKNCGNDTIAYYLLPSPVCPSGYCFGDHSPCPEGLGSPTGFTPGCLYSKAVELDNDPVLSLENRNDTTLQEIRYSCTLKPNEDHDVRMHLEVSWVTELPDGTKEFYRETKGGNLPIKFVLAENKLDNSVFGKYIKCRIRSFFMRGAYSQWKTSQERLFVGIEILGYTNRRIQLNEGDDYDIQMRVHTPYLGNTPLDLEVNIPTGARDGAQCVTGETLAQLVFGNCHIKISKDDWLNNRTITARVRASLDNKIEVATRFGKGNVLRRVFLRTPEIVFEHPVWSKYLLPPIEILVKDKDKNVAICRSVNDPHMKTFDGVSYELQQEGYFLLYKHKTQPFEVHAHFKSCRGNGRAPYCNCAVGILAVSDVIIIDKCGRGVIDMTTWGPERTRLRVATRGPCSVRRGTRILQENGGRRYVIQLHSGTSVIVQDSYSKFINLYIEASQSDFGQTEGLCGLYDQNCANDLIPKGHRQLPSGYSQHCGYARPSHPDAFRESWRLTESETILHWKTTLFENDKRVTTFDGPVFCTCNKDNAGVGVDCKVGGDVPKCKPRRTQRDVTDKRFESCRKRRETSFHDHHDFLDYEESEYSLVAQPRQEDLHEIQSKHYSPRYKRAQRHTEETARVFCRKFIFQTTAGQMCSELNVDTESPIEACVLDLVATNDENWAAAALDTVKQQCLAELDKNTTRWVPSSENANNTVPPPEIEGAVCFNECSNNGKCVNGTCDCFPGFSAPDCSINVTAAPILFYTPMCDRKTRPCRTNPVVGNGFLEDSNLTCHFYEYTIGREGLTEVGNVVINTPAEFENYAEVTCPLPLPDQLKKRRQQYEPMAYKVRVSNDGKRKSRYGVLIIFNSVCFDCNINTTSCSGKMNSCIINGSCYGNGEASPGDRRKICLPSQSRSSWSLSNIATTASPGVRNGTQGEYICGNNGVRVTFPARLSNGVTYRQAFIKGFPGDTNCATSVDGSGWLVLDIPDLRKCNITANSNGEVSFQIRLQRIPGFDGPEDGYVNISCKAKGEPILQSLSTELGVLPKWKDLNARRAAPPKSSLNAYIDGKSISFAILGERFKLCAEPSFSDNNPYKGAIIVDVMTTDPSGKKLYIIKDGCKSDSMTQVDPSFPTTDPATKAVCVVMTTFRFSGQTSTTYDVTVEFSRETKYQTDGNTCSKSKTGRKRRSVDDEPIQQVLEMKLQVSSPDDGMHERKGKDKHKGGLQSFKTNACSGFVDNTVFYVVVSVLAVLLLLAIGLACFFVKRNFTYRKNKQ